MSLFGIGPTPELKPVLPGLVLTWSIVITAVLIALTIFTGYKTKKATDGKSITKWRLFNRLAIVILVIVILLTALFFYINSIKK